jgi:hypothetical protein
MSAASRPGRGIETTSANVLRNPPASASGNFIWSSGTRVGRRIVTEFSDRNLPPVVTSLCRQCDGGGFVQPGRELFLRRSQKGIARAGLLVMAQAAYCRVQGTSAGRPPQAGFLLFCDRVGALSLPPWRFGSNFHSGTLNWNSLYCPTFNKVFSRLRERATAMPISAFLNGERFDLEAKRVLGVAFEMVCIALRAEESDDFVKQAIASRLVGLNSIEH